MTDEIATRVGRAMAEAAGFCWENCAQSQWERDAMAGIQAMREPHLSILDQEWNAAIEAAALECKQQALALRSMNGDGGEWVWPAADSMDEAVKHIRSLKRNAVTSPQDAKLTSSKSDAQTEKERGNQ